MHIKYQNIENDIDVSTGMKWGDLVEKILSKLNLIIYDIEKIIIQNVGIELGSEDLILSNIIDDYAGNIDYLLILPKDSSLNEHPFITKYNNYIIEREDERLARQLQYQDSYSETTTSNSEVQNNFLNLLNRYLTQENEENSEDDADMTGDEDIEHESSDNQYDEVINRFLDNVEAYLRRTATESQNTSTDTTNPGTNNSFLNEIQNYLRRQNSNTETEENQSTEENTEDDTTSTENTQSTFSPMQTINTPYGNLSYSIGTLNNPLGTSTLNNQDSTAIDNSTATGTNIPSHFHMYTFTAPLNSTSSNSLDYASLYPSNHTYPTNDSGSTTTSQFFNQLLNLLGNPPEMEDVKMVCTKEELEKIRIVYYKDFKNDSLCKGNQCNICLDEYEDENQLMVLNCEHYFHQACAEHWLGDCSHKCPICRQEVAKGKPLV
jgi:hypothetical protein